MYARVKNHHRSSPSRPSSMILLFFRPDFAGKHLSAMATTMPDTRRELPFHLARLLGKFFLS